MIQIDSLNTLYLSSLKGINKIQLNKLAKIGLYTVQDLLLHIPLRYENRSNFLQIRDLVPGIYATIKGKIINYYIICNNRQIIIFKVSDGSGILTIKFFNFSKLSKNISNIKYSYILAYGEIKLGRYGLEMVHPKYTINNSISDSEFKKNLIPIYKTTEGLKQSTLLKLTNQALNILNNYAIIELLPPELVKNMISLTEAIRILHRPPLSIDIRKLNNRNHPAKKRLIIEELLAFNLNILKLRSKTKLLNAQPLLNCNNLKKRFLSSISLKLTNAQNRVISEIENDMSLNIPMMRLVQGDVGCGKTLIAALAAINAISNGKQVALMAPTELLIKQHIEKFCDWFVPFGIKLGCLTSKQQRKDKLLQQKDIADGKIQMVLGTHAIFQKQVKFNNLALIIIDEQHRFGVNQRFFLWKKGIKEDLGYYPHQLIMTATPIPRTLAMTIYANLDISIIDEMPPGRKPITTVAIPDNRRKDINDRIRYVCINEGRQVYWICTLITESDPLEIKAAENICKDLKLTLPELNIGLVHGKMKSSEKQEIIRKFKLGYLHMLVATTVIEVGIDIPNASLMIIENPERLGLAQLHQLRGRIGRGSVTSYCILLYKPPLSKIAKQRIQVIRNNNDGFLIAQKDMEIRGPGEILGTRQKGNLKFKIADLLIDHKINSKINYLAKYFYEKYPKQTIALINRWKIKSKYFNNI